MRTPTPMRTHRGFNPVLGFLSVATRRRSRTRRPATHVSIPFWVFSPLRPEKRVCDYDGSQFQSRSGFSLRCDLESKTLTALSEWFQSRSGFSLRCDGLLTAVKRVSNPVSIPFWVFSPLRQLWEESTGDITYLFQSRSGFSLRCDRLQRMQLGKVIFVSIPFWVFSPLRRLVSRALSSRTASFNPVLGFLSVATGGQYSVIDIKKLSHPLKLRPGYVDWGYTAT